MFPVRRTAESGCVLGIAVTLWLSRPSRPLRSLVECSRLAGLPNRLTAITISPTTVWRPGLWWMGR